MHHISFFLGCVLSLIYLVTCNPRAPDESTKPHGSPSTSDLDPISDQLDSALLTNEEDPEKRGDWHKLSNVWGKRADWNKLNNMWGKRDWNKLNNMWGKRETNELSPYLSGKRGWNNLSNVWGKRGWNNLSNVWGKRASNRDDGSKRTTQWNNLKSVWGKRDAGYDGPLVWDALPLEDSYPGLYAPEQM